MKILKIKVDAGPEVFGNLEAYARDCRLEAEGAILDRQWSGLVSKIANCCADFKRYVLPKLKSKDWSSSKVDSIATRLSKCQKEAKETLKLQHSPKYAKAVSALDGRILEALRYLDTLY